MDDDRIYTRIFDAILEHRLAPNKKINEEELTQIFGVSRTIIRRVLLRLSLDGAVVLPKNRGAYVAMLTSDQVQELYAARRIIEQGIVATACKNAGKKDIQRLKRIIELEHESIKSGDRGSRIRLSGEFHLAIAEIAGNRLLHGYLRQLVVQTSIARACFEQRGVSPCSSHDHLDLVEAIAEGAVDKATRLIVNHLQSSESELYVESPTEDEELKSIFG